MMNREAARLGMKNTHFMIPPACPTRSITARRRPVPARCALIRDFPAEYGQYYSQKEFRATTTLRSEPQPLLWLDPTVDGVKTGHTEAAGFCLIASSRRGGRRLPRSCSARRRKRRRAQESQKLLNWGFQFFDSVKLYAAATP